MPKGFQFLNFYILGISVLQKLYSRVVKNRIFCSLGLGVRPNDLTPLSLFIVKNFTIGCSNLQKNILMGALLLHTRVYMKKY